MPAERAVFRSLLRAARGYDRHPQHLATLLGWPSCVFDRGANRVVRQAVTKCPLAEDAVWEACGGSIEFSHPSGRAAAAVRKHRRRMGALGLDYLPGARVLLGRFEDAQRSADRVLAAAASQEKTVLPPLELEFISGPRTGQRLVLGERAAERVEGKLTLAEPADGAAAPVRGPAPCPPDLLPLLGAAVAAPCGRAAPPPLRRVSADDPSPCSVGQLLIAHPLSLDQDRRWTSRQPSLDQAVMLITSADIGSGYVRGVVLNSPARGTLRSVLAAWSCRSGEGGIVQMEEDDRRLMEALEPLLDAPLLSGGELVAGTLSDSITWLHTLGPAVPGSREVAPSLWLGGDVASLAGLVASGQAQRGRVRPVLGHACWPLPQLELELRRGAWIRARMATAEVSQQLCMSTVAADDPTAREGQRTRLWREALRATGIAGLAEFPRGRSVDGVIRAIMHEHYRDMRFTRHERV